MFLPTYAFSIYLIGYQATDITKKENKLISSQSNMSNETVWFVLPTVDVVGHQAYLPTYLPTYLRTYTNEFVYSCIRQLSNNHQGVNGTLYFRRLSQITQLAIDKTIGDTYSI